MRAISDDVNSTHTQSHGALCTVVGMSLDIM